MKNRNQTKVSVIVPVYNAESYIEKCISSLLEQTFQDIEIIFVDDGSTDNSLNIIKGKQKQDSRIRFFSQKNQYAGAARNKGLNEAVGKYILFLDADDFFEEDMIKDLYIQAEAKEADIVLCGAYRYDDRTGNAVEQKHWLRTDCFPSDVFSHKDMGDNLFIVTNNAVWNKLFNRQFIIDNNIRFQTLHNTNDMYFMMLSLACAERITYIDHPYVYYRAYTFDNIQSKKKNHPLDFLKALEALKEALIARNVYPEIKEAFRLLASHVIRYGLVTVDDETREVIADALKENKLFNEVIAESPVDDPVACRIKRIIKGTAFKKKIAHTEAVSCLKKSGISDPLCSVILCYPAGFDPLVYENILNQSEKKLEIILAGELSDEIISASKKEKRIALLQTPDQGRSGLRSVALKEAKGKYIYFADRALIMADNALETMIKRCETKDLEMLFIGKKELEVKVMDGISLVSALLDAGVYESSLDHQLIDRVFLKKTGNVLTCGSSNEDSAFTLRNLIKATRTSYLGSDIISFSDVKEETQTYQNLYDHYQNYLQMSETVQKDDLFLPENILSLPLKEKEKTISVYETLPEEERLHQETMDGYARKQFTEEIVKAAKAKQKQKDLQNKLKRTENELANVQERYDKVLQSRSYRFGRLLMWLPHKLKKLFKRKGK